MYLMNLCNIIYHTRITQEITTWKVENKNFPNNYKLVCKRLYGNSVILKIFLTGRNKKIVYFYFSK